MGLGVSREASFLVHCYIDYNGIHCYADVVGPIIMTTRILAALTISVNLACGQISPLKIYISVDMEGIGGIGTAAMVSSTGKDYGTGRKLMTDEVNAVVSAIFQLFNRTKSINKFGAKKLMHGLTVTQQFNRIF